MEELYQDTFELAEDSPCFFVAIRREQGEIELDLEAANPLFLDYLHLREDPVGKCVGELFPLDTMAVEEWLDYATSLQAVLDSDRLPEFGSEIQQHTILQFLRTTRRWTWTTLICQRGNKSFLVRFDPLPETDTIPIRREEILRTTQHLWLNRQLTLVGQWEIHLQDGRVFFSRRMAMVLDMGEQACVVGMSEFLDLLHGDDRPLFVSMLDVVADADLLLFHRCVGRGGKTIYCHSHATACFDADGQLASIIGRSEELTEQYLSDQDHIQNRQLFQQLVESSPEMIAVLDADFRYVYVSANCKRILGVSAEVCVGSRFGTYMTPDALSKNAMEEFYRIVARKETGTIECSLSTRGNAFLWASFQVHTVLDELGEIQSVFVYCHDITQRKRRERRLEYLSTHDRLTGVFNRVTFEEELERLQQEQTPHVALVLADIDGLRLINQVYGNAQGDLLIQQAANILSGACGCKHFLARIGGSEFALILHDATPALEDRTCARIHGECSKTRYHLMPLKISIGTAHRKDGGISMNTLLRLAQNRMQYSKQLSSQSVSSSVITSLLETLRVRNVETADHVERMTSMVREMGAQSGLTRSELDRLTMLASMHDIGKIAIPDHILNKPGPLTDAEWEIMMSHCAVGMQIALSTHELACIAKEIGCHHERWDGTGYPHKKAGDDIPLLARMISVVDAYDAMTHARVYKKARSPEAAVAELQRHSGTQFDPELVSLFVRLFAQRDPDASARPLSPMAPPQTP